MDLNHALPFLSPMRICAGTYEALADCGIIIIAAGAGQAKGETRIDLLKKNRAILRTILDGIKPVNTEAILLLVSNPVDILTYIALDLSGFDPHRVIGSGTVLPLYDIRIPRSGYRKRYIFCNPLQNVSVKMH